MKVPTFAPHPLRYNRKHSPVKQHNDGLAVKRVLGTVQRAQRDYSFPIVTADPARLMPIFQQMISGEKGTPLCRADCAAKAEQQQLLLQIWT